MKIIMNDKINNGLGAIAACYTHDPRIVGASCGLMQTHGATVGAGVDVGYLADNMPCPLVIVDNNRVMGFGNL